MKTQTIQYENRRRHRHLPSEPSLRGFARMFNDPAVCDYSYHLDVEAQAFRQEKFSSRTYTAKESTYREIGALQHHLDPNPSMSGTGNRRCKLSTKLNGNQRSNKSGSQAFGSLPLGLPPRQTTKSCYEDQLIVEAQ